MRLIVFLVIVIVFKSTLVTPQQCSSINDKCESNKNEHAGKILILYSVSPYEGFNLRRDVYLRIAVAVRRSPSILTLVLPPWYRIPHWRSTTQPLRWDNFFQPEPMKQFVPVVELTDVRASNDPFIIDHLYRLTHFENAFEGGSFVEKWQIKNSSSCQTPIDFWGYEVEVKNDICIAFQGSASKIFELLALHPEDDVVMFSNAEILLHDEYGTAEYWRARQSVQFHDRLISISKKFIFKYLECETTQCFNYFSVHWRRGDFARGRPKQVPSVEGAANQLIKISQKPELNLKLMFLATDANSSELNVFDNIMKNHDITVIRFVPKPSENLIEGAIAIIDQIICSRAAYFIGTHESTFTFRIQEEREIMGYKSETTFNRLCPDHEPCEKPSQWKIVH